jgi:hypothetical protein
MASGQIAFTLDDLHQLEKENSIMRNDLNNLIDAYWFAISTRDCKLFPSEQIQNEVYCKLLIEKYHH